MQNPRIQWTTPRNVGVREAQGHGLAGKTWVPDSWSFGGMCTPWMQREQAVVVYKNPAQAQPPEALAASWMTEVAVQRGQSPGVWHRTLSDKPDFRGAMASDGDEVQVFLIPSPTPRAGLGLRERSRWQILFVISPC